jgi:hypothetical protein
MKCVYGIQFEFTVDRELSEEELDNIINAVSVQVEEPAGLNGEKRATFTVSDLLITSKRWA